MVKVNVKEARGNLSSLLDQVEQGEEFLITRRGKGVARLIAPDSCNLKLPSLKEFRATVTQKGVPMSETVVKLRSEGRY